MDNNRITQKDTYIILTITMLFIVGSIVGNISLIYGFVGAILVTSGILIKRGFSVRELSEMTTAAIIECKSLYILILLIGATVSVWLSSGVVTAIIYYGLTYMKGMNFLFSAFIITSIMALFMGTAIGTISTIGIALLGIGQGFGIPTHILFGAVISGAFIADKISPISGLLNLTLTTTKIKYRDAVKTMMSTLIPVYLITIAIYYCIGRSYSSTANTEALIEYQNAILVGFNISPWLLLLPVLILVLSVIGIKTIKTISLGLLGGVFTSILLQKQTLKSVLEWIFFGFRGATASIQLNNILVSGGVVSMLEVVLIVAGAIILSSLLEKSGILKPILSRTIGSIGSRGELILKTGLISSILTIATCDQTVGIILPGRLLQDKYKELEVDNTVLARTISDTGTIIAPLFPWNVNALIIGMISGVPAIAYAPYAVLCYLCPLVTLLYSMKLKNKRNMKSSQI